MPLLVGHVDDLRLGLTLAYQRLVPLHIQIALEVPPAHELAQVREIPAHVLLVRVDVLPLRAVPPPRRHQRRAAVALDVLADRVEAVRRVRRAAFLPTYYRSASRLVEGGGVEYAASASSINSHPHAWP